MLIFIQYVNAEFICVIFFVNHYYEHLFLVVIKNQSTGTVSDKVRNRLEQLDDFEEVCSQVTIMLRAVLGIFYSWLLVYT